MGDFFKMPNDQSSIAEADDIVRLQAENDRAVEDAINKMRRSSGDGGVYTGTFSSLTASLTGLPDGVYGVTATYEIETTDPTVSIYATAYAASDIFEDVRTAETFPTGASVVFTWSGFAVVQVGSIFVSGSVSTTPTAETLTITAVRLGNV